MKSENDFISDDELIEVTGYKYPSKQCEALTRAGISFITRKDGRPSVTWSALNATLSDFSVKTVPDDTPEQPNFDAM